MKESQSAISVLDSLSNIVNSSDWTNAENLINLVKLKGKVLIEKNIGETVILNTLLRILKIIREESVRIIKGVPDFEEKLTNILFADRAMNYKEVNSEAVREPIQGSIEEFRSEIMDCLLNMASQSLWHIHSNEIIFTVGYSEDVFRFLKYAAEYGRRRFQVMVAECSPDNHGHRMAMDLEKEKIDVILLPDSHAFAVMSRVNKVIVSCHTVYADGGVRAVVGTHGVMLAAQRFSVPIYVCVPPYKVSPKFFPPNPSDWLSNPATLAPDYFISKTGDGDSSSSNTAAEWEVENPAWDYIPQGLVSLFITNLAGNAPSYIHAMVREFFHIDDIQEAIAWDE